VPELKAVDRGKPIKMLQYTFYQSKSKIELEAEITDRFTPLNVTIIQQPKLLTDETPNE
jgi:hypothetical protein